MLKNMIMLRRLIIENRNDKITISLIKILRIPDETNINPVPNKNIFNNKSNTVYLISGFKNMDHLMKSLIIV